MFGWEGRGGGGWGGWGDDTVFDEGVGFNMSQLAPRTRIIADTYVPFRWKPGLCSTFCCCWGKKKQRSLALDTRFDRNNAAAKRLRDEKLRSSSNAGGSRVCVCMCVPFWHNPKIQLSNSSSAKYRYIPTQSIPCDVWWDFFCRYT